MKKLFMKQKVISAIDRFTVKDENEEDRFLIEGQYIQIGGKKLFIKDMAENELLMVQQKLIALMPKFFVFRGDEQVAVVQKKVALLGSKYIIEGPGWEVKGKILGHDYSITRDGREIVKLHKVWLSWGDSYEIDIEDDIDETLVLAVVLAIEMVLEQQAQNRAASAEVN